MKTNLILVAILAAAAIFVGFLFLPSSKTNVSPTHERNPVRPSEWPESIVQQAPSSPADQDESVRHHREQQLAAMLDKLAKKHGLKVGKLEIRYVSTQKRPHIKSFPPGDYWLPGELEEQLHRQNWPPETSIIVETSRIEEENLPNKRVQPTAKQRGG